MCVFATPVPTVCMGGTVQVARTIYGGSLNFVLGSLKKYPLVKKPGFLRDHRSDSRSLGAVGHPDAKLILFETCALAKNLEKAALCHVLVLFRDKFIHLIKTSHVDRKKPMRGLIFDL